MENTREKCLPQSLENSSRGIGVYHITTRTATTEKDRPICLYTEIYDNVRKHEQIKEKSTKLEVGGIYV